MVDSSDPLNDILVFEVEQKIANRLMTSHQRTQLAEFDRTETHPLESRAAAGTATERTKLIAWT